jgi:Putative auto-transporter adhesin, head GIN domain
MIRQILPLFALALVASGPALASDPIALPHFDSIELRGGGSVVVVRGPAERVAVVEGSDAVTRIHVEHGSELVIDTCTRDCPRLYRLRVEIQSPTVPDLGVTGGGEIQVRSGFASQPQLSAAVSGGGRIDAREIKASDVSAAVNGGGELLVRAGSTLSGAVNGGGLVRYWGSPEVSSAIAGGGAIRRGY